VPDLVKILSAAVEYQARFARPCIGFIGNDRPRAVEAIVDALQPFNFRLANSEVLVTGSMADHKVIFRIPDRGISLQFGAEEYRFAKDGANWATEDDDTKILLAAERALLEGSPAEIAQCAVHLGLHLQPLTKTREEVLARFIPEPFRAMLTDRNGRTYGNHLKWPDGDLLLDFSAAFANGIFLRSSSIFAGHPPATEILAKMRSDEEALFQILGIEEHINE
jgi:hypothetical protein